MLFAAGRLPGPPARIARRPAPAPKPPDPATAFTRRPPAGTDCCPQATGSEAFPRLPSIESWISNGTLPADAELAEFEPNKDCPENSLLQKRRTVAFRDFRVSGTARPSRPEFRPLRRSAMPGTAPCQVLQKKTPTPQSVPCAGGNFPDHAADHSFFTKLAGEIGPRAVPLAASPTLFVFRKRLRHRSPSPTACRCRRSGPPWATPICRPPRSTPPPRASRRGSFWPGCGPKSRIRSDPASEGLLRGPVARMAWVSCTERWSAMRVTGRSGTPEKAFWRKFQRIAA